LPISEGGDNKEEGVHASQKSKKKRGKKEELEAEMLALQKRQQEILAHMMTDNSDADSDLGISLNVSGVAPCHDTVEDFDMASFEQSEFDLPQMSGGDTSDTAVFGAACHHPSFLSLPFLQLLLWSLPTTTTWLPRCPRTCVLRAETATPTTLQ